jgi:hypothetical protein
VAGVGRELLTGETVWAQLARNPFAYLLAYSMVVGASLINRYFPFLHLHRATRCIIAPVVDGQFPLIETFMLLQLFVCIFRRAAVPTTVQRPADRVWGSCSAYGSPTKGIGPFTRTAELWNGRLGPGPLFMIVTLDF